MKTTTETRDRISEMIWENLHDKSFFIPTEQLNACADRIMQLIQKEKKELLEKAISLNDKLWMGKIKPKTYEKKLAEMKGNK